jgi:hypothetical protein
MSLVSSKLGDPHTPGHSNTREKPIMFYALSWIVVASLVALWSLVAWALHAVAVWTISNAGALAGAAPGAFALSLPDWLAPWVPPEVTPWMSQLLSGLGSLVDGLLQTAPALAGAVTVATWGVWGIGSVLLVLLGAGVHLLIGLWRRRGGGSGPHAGSPLAAG